MVLYLFNTRLWNKGPEFLGKANSIGVAKKEIKKHFAAFPIYKIKCLQNAYFYSTFFQNSCFLIINYFKPIKKYK